MFLNKESLIKKGNKKGELIIKHATMMCFKAQKMCWKWLSVSVIVREREEKKGREWEIELPYNTWIYTVTEGQ